MSVTMERIVGDPVISGRRVLVQATTWRGEDGTSYDLLDGDTGVLLTVGESWDAYPSTGQMTAVLREHATTFCRFCQLGIIGATGHLTGNAAPGENPWCCDGCWDPRLA